jgi:uncharacterized protein
MKLLLLLLVLLVAVAWVSGRFGRGKRRSAPPEAPSTAAAKPAEMLACSHCGVHLPLAETAFDAEGRAFCSAEHRVAGPR